MLANSRTCRYRRYAEATTLSKVPAKETPFAPPPGVSPICRHRPTRIVCLGAAAWADTEASSAFQGVECGGRHQAGGENDTTAARRRRSEPRTCSRGCENRIQRRWPGCQPRNRRANRRRRHRHALSPFPDARGLVRSGVPPRGPAACRSGRAIEEKSRARRSIAPMDAFERQVCRDKKRHVAGAGARRLQELGALFLFVRSADPRRRRATRARHRGRRNPQRCQPGRSAAGARRHELHE